MVKENQAIKTDKDQVDDKDQGNQATKPTRRRGPALEEAILLAAWEELAETGYANLTMETIASRAKTNKAVLYRRWADKSELIIAALQRYMPKMSSEIPHSGDLRNDMYTYLCACIEPLRSIGEQTIRGLLAEPRIWRMMSAALPQIIQRRLEINSESRIAAGMKEILKEAEARGEVDLSKLPSRVITLPLDLLQDELLTKHGPVSTETIAEIIDDIFMPLVRATIQ